MPLFPKLEVYANDQHWELKGQILILCSNTLTAFNGDDENEEEKEMIEQRDEEMMEEFKDDTIQDASEIKEQFS